MVYWGWVAVGVYPRSLALTPGLILKGQRRSFRKSSSAVAVNTPQLPFQTQCRQLRWSQAFGGGIWNV